MQRYYIHRNAGQSVFVKEGLFFEAQKADSIARNEREWWRAWTLVIADGMEHARMIGERDLPRYVHTANVTDEG